MSTDVVMAALIDVVMAALIMVLLSEIAIGYAIAIAAETWKRRKKDMRVVLSLVRTILRPDGASAVICRRCGWQAARDEVSALQHINAEKQWRQVDLWMLRLH